MGPGHDHGYQITGDPATRQVEIRSQQHEVKFTFGEGKR